MHLLEPLSKGPCDKADVCHRGELEEQKAGPAPQKGHHFEYVGRAVLKEEDFLSAPVPSCGVGIDYIVAAESHSGPREGVEDKYIVSSESGKMCCRLGGERTVGFEGINSGAYLGESPAVGPKTAAQVAQSAFPAFHQSFCQPRLVERSQL